TASSSKEESAKACAKYDDDYASCKRRVEAWRTDKLETDKGNAAIRQTRSMGPVGGGGGIPFQTVVLEPGSHITELFGRSGAEVDNIGFRYVDGNGAEKNTGNVGHGLGGRTFSFPIQVDAGE